MFAEIDLIAIWHEAAASLSYLNSGLILAAAFWTIAIVWSVVREFFFLRLRIGQMGGDGLTPEQRARSFFRRSTTDTSYVSPAYFGIPDDWQSGGESRRNW